MPKRVLPKKTKPKSVKGGWLIALMAVLILGIAAYAYFLRDWNITSRFTVIEFKPKQTSVLSFDPKTERGVRLVLPPDLEISTTQGRGQFTLQSLSEAGSSEWAAESVANTLGIFSQGDLKNLRLGDQLLWWWWQSRVDWQDIDLKSTAWIDYNPSVDGVLLGQLASGWVNQVGLWFNSLGIAQEGLSLEIINTTSVDGLAAWAARPIEASGIKVAHLSYDQSAVNKCVLKVPTHEHKLIGWQVIKQHFNCDLISGDTPTLILGMDNQRVFLGL